MTRTTDNKRCLVNATSPYQLVFRVGSCLFRVFFNILSPSKGGSVFCVLRWEFIFVRHRIIKYVRIEVYVVHLHLWYMIVACWFRPSGSV